MVFIMLSKSIGNMRMFVGTEPSSSFRISLLTSSFFRKVCLVTLGYQSCSERSLPPSVAQSLKIRSTLSK